MKTTRLVAASRRARRAVTRRGAGQATPRGWLRPPTRGRSGTRRPVTGWRQPRGASGTRALGDGGQELAPWGPRHAEGGRILAPEVPEAELLAALDGGVVADPGRDHQHALLPPARRGRGPCCLQHGAVGGARAAGRSRPTKLRAGGRRAARAPMSPKASTSGAEVALASIAGPPRSTAPPKRSSYPSRPGAHPRSETHNCDLLAAGRSRDRHGEAHTT